METEKFEQLVAKAIEGLPKEIQDSLENIDIIVADVPTAAQRRYEKTGRG